MATVSFKCINTNNNTYCHRDSNELKMGGCNENSNEIHFKLVGYFDGNIMQTIFHQKNIPIEILKLINQLR